MLGLVDQSRRWVLLPGQDPQELGLGRSADLAAEVDDGVGGVVGLDDVVVGRGRHSLGWGIVKVDHDLGWLLSVVRLSQSSVALGHHQIFVSIQPFVENSNDHFAVCSEIRVLGGVAGAALFEGRFVFCVFIPLSSVLFDVKVFHDFESGTSSRAVELSIGDHAGTCQQYQKSRLHLFQSVVVGLLS